ncbi:hypothetical protein HPP92_003794 [Vanilla planifolia]|uniref:WAT1-related protein n=1 Tax=Vanilla planifolia TaxID=51239 RepID=A0A835VLU5_VANPL|nr:hypothetical protein HPP92_003794 [Vanilla planifolia]
MQIKETKYKNIILKKNIPFCDMPNLKDGLRCKAAQKAKPYAAMLMLNLGFAGMYVLSSATLKDGMNQNVLIVYRNVFAAAAIAPFALYSYSFFGF